MSKLRVHSFSISINGFGEGLGNDLENPLGVGGLKLRTLTQPFPEGEETSHPRPTSPKWRGEVVLTRANLAADAWQRRWRDHG